MKIPKLKLLEILEKEKGKCPHPEIQNCHLCEDDCPRDVNEGLEKAQEVIKNIDKL